MPDPVEVSLSEEAMDAVKGGAAQEQSIAVVIPVHETHLAYLPAAIESVLQLGEAPDELVIVDDGQCGVPDIWNEYIDQLEKQGILSRYRFTAEQRGAAAARNLGIEATRTDWVLCLDADDRLKPEALTAWRDALTETPNADVVVFGYEAFGTGLNGEPATGTRTYDEHGFGLVEAYRSNKRLACAASPFRRRLWEWHPYRRGFGLFEDTAFWLDCARHGAYFASVQEPLVDVRYHEQRTSFTRPDAEREQNRRKLDQIAEEAEATA